MVRDGYIIMVRMIHNTAILDTKPAPCQPLLVSFAVLASENCEWDAGRCA
jgi:hypothetical protein